MNTTMYIYKEKTFTGWRVARQGNTFTRTISRNQRLPTKTQEKEHVNMAWSGPTIPLRSLSQH